MITFNHQDQTVYLWTASPNWRDRFRADMGVPSTSETGLSDQESRRFTAQALRVAQIQFAAILTGQDYQDLADALRTITTERVAMPFWPAMRETAIFADYGVTSGLHLTCNLGAGGVPDTSQFAIHAAATPDPADWTVTTASRTVPLLFGYLDHTSPRLLAPDVWQVAVKWYEDSAVGEALQISDHTWLDGPTRQGQSHHVFPFPPDFTQPLQAGGTRLLIDRETIGQGRRARTIYHDAAPREAANMTILLPPRTIRWVQVALTSTLKPDDDFRIRVDGSTAIDLQRNQGTYPETFQWQAPGDFRNGADIEVAVFDGWQGAWADSPYDVHIRWDDAQSDSLSYDFPGIVTHPSDPAIPGYAELGLTQPVYWLETGPYGVITEQTHYHAHTSYRFVRPERWAVMARWLCDHGDVLPCWVPVQRQVARLTAAPVDDTIQVDDAAALQVGDVIAMVNATQFFAAEITSVQGLTITLDRSITSGFASDTLLCPARLCRSGKRRIRFDWIDAESARTAIEFRELRSEVDEIQAAPGAQTTTATLYELSDNNTTWRYTSYETDLTLDQHTFSAAHISHGDITRGISVDDRVSIEAQAAANHPLWLWHRGHISQPSIIIRRVDVSNGVASQPAILFQGVVGRPKLSANKINAGCTMLGRDAEQFIPKIRFQRACNWSLFSSACGLSKSDWMFTAAVVSVDSHWPYRITINNISRNNGDALTTFWADWFAFGTATVDGQAATITSSTAEDGGQIVLTLERALANDPAAGAAISLIPGCDGRLGTCDNKFITTNITGTVVSYTTNLAKIWAQSLFYFHFQRLSARIHRQTTPPVIDDKRGDMVITLDQPYPANQFAGMLLRAGGREYLIDESAPTSGDMHQLIFFEVLPSAPSVGETVRILEGNIANFGGHQVSTTNLLILDEPSLRA